MSAAAMLDEQHADEATFSRHDFAWLELQAKRSYLARRIQIAQVKMEHGLLFDWEQDALALESAELREEIRLWGKYR
jgi:hypothetical protein